MGVSESAVVDRSRLLCLDNGWTRS